MTTCNGALPPQVTRRVAKEIAEMIKSPPEGISIVPNESDISDIQALIYGPSGTPYAGGHFRVKLVLGQQFPNSPPKGYFITRIFHPNVSPKGEICVNTLKKDWKPEYGVKHILLIIKCLLIVPNPESALNEEAAKLLLEHYDEYFARAKMVTEIHAQPATNEKENCNGMDDNDKAQSTATINITTTAASMKNSANEQSLNKKINHQVSSFDNGTMKATLAISKTVNKDKKRLKRL